MEKFDASRHDAIVLLQSLREFGWEPNGVEDGGTPETPGHVFNRKLPLSDLADKHIDMVAAFIAQVTSPVRQRARDRIDELQDQLKRLDDDFIAQQKAMELKRGQLLVQLQELQELLRFNT